MEKLNDQMMEQVAGGTLTEEEALAAALQKAGLEKGQLDFMKKIDQIKHDIATDDEIKK